jgi:hypothetical protein
MTWKRIVLFVLGTAVVGLAGRVTAKPAETPRTVYLSAVDAKGAPVTDLTTADLAVKEGGQDRVIASLKEATTPMEVAILDDDDGSGFFQAGILQLLQALGDRAVYSISRFNPQYAKILDYTNDVGPIQGALDQIGRRGKVQRDGELVTDAISLASKELQQRKAARRVMLLLTLSGEGQTRNPDITMTDLLTSGAMLNVIHHSSAKVGLVGGDGPKLSGGRIEQVGAISAVPAAITKIADTLLHQYALTYTLPDGVKPSDRLSVTTNRKGVSLIAPSRIPDK